MAKAVLALVLGIVVAACGAVPSQGSSHPAPAPPTAALTKWKDFPANATPRPIISFGDAVEHIQEAGFPDNDRKIAWICGKFVLGSGVTLPVLAPGPAVVAGSSYPSIGAAQAFSEVMASRVGGGNPADCAAARPFTITAVRWGTAGFPTDRGTMQMSAWLFDVPEVNAYIGHSALDPSAYWGGRMLTPGRGARISADGRTLEVPVSNAEPGLCGSDYTASAAQSPAAVAVAVAQFPHASPGEPVNCNLSLRISYIEVVLNAPLGGRVLLDENGNVGAVCPKTSDC